VDEFLVRRPEAARDPELAAIAALVAQAFLPVRSPLKETSTGKDAYSAWREDRLP
jgi:hypothetical protein